MKTRLLSLYLIIVSMWWGWTVLTDFFIVRIVFANVSNFFEAGNLGIEVFSKLNRLEVIAATLLFILLTRFSVKERKIRKFAFLSLITALIVYFYSFYLIDRIRTLTALWQEADARGELAANGIPDVQQSHQFFHRLYIWIDSVKLILLSVMLGLGVFRPKDFTCES